MGMECLRDWRERMSHINGLVDDDDRNMTRLVRRLLCEKGEAVK